MRNSSLGHLQFDEIEVTDEDDEDDEDGSGDSWEMIDS